MACARVELRSTDKKQLVLRTAAALRRGELCILPTETVYGLAVLPSHAGAVARARSLLRRDPSQPFTLHLATRDAARVLAPDWQRPEQRLADRFWPGPLTLVLPTSNGDTGLRLCAHEWTRSVIAAVGEPIWLGCLPWQDQPALADPAHLAEHYGAAVDLLVDDGKSPLGNASTVVHRRGPRLEVTRTGILTADEVLLAAATLTLFVCTGNTCRSPLAEALARESMARRLGVAAADVLAHGHAFASAGTSTIEGLPASDGSLAAGAEIGLDLTRHRSQPITRQLAMRANRIYCLAQSHRRALLAEVPEVADKVSMLRGDQLDIADPYGGELPRYRRTRDEISSSIELIQGL
ncbi:MAG: Sua5/YciO/YrdC/YwlC family protein [Planctomycetes bacterium]|jgi:protein-tyrosine phosphatase|nr:Sua5/YciO/YrdC/YwlC family protein [Planctomycetota bacterium]